MVSLFGWRARGGAVLNESRNPWGSGSGGGGGGGSDGDGEDSAPRNPWAKPPRKRPSRTEGSLDDFLKRSRERIGRPFPPRGGGRPYWLYGLVGFVAIWLVFTSIHRVGDHERGVVTRLGRYEATLEPGLNLTLPAPFDTVQLVSDETRTESFPQGGDAENLLLTGDQNLVNLDYSVHWTISDPHAYLFHLADPHGTIRQVAESTMRAAIARASLSDALAAGRGDIPQRVRDTMQRQLDGYGAGVHIAAVSIVQALPPQAVNTAVQDIATAQQQAQTYRNDATTYRAQQIARAQLEADAFDSAYAQYRAAPEVTRRRMYYETMERILSHVDTIVIDAPGVTPNLTLPPAEPLRQPPRAAEPRPSQ